MQLLAVRYTDFIPENNVTTVGHLSFGLTEISVF